MATSSIEKVTNNSGSNYCKMPDGTLIQWGSVSMACTTEGGPLGYYGTATVNFPVAFKTASYVIIPTIQEVASYWNANGYVSSTTQGVVCIGGNNTVSKNVRWFAMGRWK